jgi:catechol 2,3-dioxygenase-like lactoylglutathione lyase family enzyme
VIRKLYHITFPVSDLKRTATFYENVLCLKKTGEWPNYVEFDVGGVHFGLKPSGKLEVFLLVDDIDKAYQDLREKGVKFVTEPRDQPWGGRAAPFIDPGGNMFILESFKCKVCSKISPSHIELGEHMKEHKEHVKE